MNHDPQAPVYPEFHKGGVRFRLYRDGTIMAGTKDLASREIGKLSVSGENRPWIPSHKNFNSLCRQMVREGDVDELVAEQRHISEARGMKRKAGEELFDALEALVAIHECCDETGYIEGEGAVDVDAVVEKARIALAKARGK